MTGNEVGVFWVSEKVVQVEEEVEATQLPKPHAPNTRPEESDRSEISWSESGS